MNADYAFRISGRVPLALTEVLEPLKSVETGADTLLVGPVTDRAALHGYIAHLEALGLELVELRRLPAGDDGRHGCPCCGRVRRRAAVALEEPGPVAEHRSGQATEQRYDGERGGERQHDPRPRILGAVDVGRQVATVDRPHTCTPATVGHESRVNPGVAAMARAARDRRPSGLPPPLRVTTSHRSAPTVEVCRNPTATAPV